MRTRLLNLGLRQVGNKFVGEGITVVLEGGKLYVEEEEVTLDELERILMSL